jgi:hypothetical protein
MSRPARPGRVAVGSAALALVALIAALDLATAERIDPIRVPAPAALGSGVTASVAHCAAPPPSN